MRKALFVLLPLAIIALIAFAAQSQEPAAPKWLDPAGCYFCQPLTQTEGLMDHVGWEDFKLKNGMVSVVTYPAEWKEKFKACSKEMEKRWSTFDPANPQPLCGMCSAWMKMPMDKIAWETVEFTGGEMSITTTSDSVLLAQLHEITDKTCAALEEYKKMKAAPEAK